MVNKVKYKFGLFLAAFFRWILPHKKNSAVILSRQNFLFIISSTICPTVDPIRYIKKSRSDFDPYTRLLQTINTIKSIQNKMPGASILLIENSNIPLEYRVQLESECSSVLYYSSDRIARNLRDSKNKGSGEAYMMIKTLKKFDIKKFRGIFKISGRYELSDDFNINNFCISKINFLKTEGVVSTRLYYIPTTMCRLYFRQLICSLLATVFGVSLEDVISRGLKSADVNFVSKLGVKGLIGTDAKVMINE